MRRRPAEEIHPATAHPIDQMRLESPARSGDPGTEAIDTRRPDSLSGRVYAAPYARVWDLLHDEIDGRRLWSVVHSDEGLGLLTAVCRSWLPWNVGHLTVWVRLDENALTRVDVRSWSRRGIGFPGVDRRRVRAVIAGLDRGLGREARIGS
ncbi:MAG: DUF1499 domain-containing protein [Gemmatimonadota bacterium]